MNTNISAKRILIYGDSYVFGKIPSGLRYDSATRFTGVMQSYLGSDYEIIEEGLRGRQFLEKMGSSPSVTVLHSLTESSGVIYHSI